MFKTKQHKLPQVELSGKLAGKSLPMQVMVLALWPFLQNLMATVVSFVDMIISGHLEPEDIHGYDGHADVAKAMIEMMGPVVYVQWLMIILQGSIATGAQALVSRATGARDRELGEKAFGQAIVLGFVSGVVAGGLIYIFSDLIVRVANISPQASEFAKIYISIVSLSAPLSGVMFVVNSCLRASGDTLRPFYAMLVVNVLNAVFSAILVYAPAPIGGHGAGGIAMGTVLGWVAGVVLVLWIVRAKRQEYGVDDPLVLKWKFVRFCWSLSKRILKISLPNTIEVLGMCAVHIVGFLYIAQIGNRYMEKHGAEAEGVIVGAHALAVRIESLSFMPGFALGMAAATLSGQYLGAESKEMAKIAVRVCWKYALLIMGTAGVLMFIFAEPLVGLMIKGEGEQKMIAVQIVHIFAFAQPLFATAMVMKMSMRGAGATKLVMAYSFTIMILVRVLLLGWYVSQPDATVHGAWRITILDLILQAIVFVTLHYRGKWADAKV